MNWKSLKIDGYPKKSTYCFAYHENIPSEKFLVWFSEDKKIFIHEACGWLSDLIAGLTHYIEIPDAHDEEN